jgi:superfamily I DNA/RNA helicase
LFRLAYKFIKNNDHFSIGAKFITQLKTDLAKVCKNCKSLAEIRKNTMRDYEKALSKASNSSWSTTNIENKYDGLLYIIDSAKEVKDIARFLKSLILHSNSSSKRKLMTIHGAKGLESEIVYFIKPSQCGKYKEKAKSEWEKIQEDNLYYVACTRALNHLVFVE